MGLFKLIANIFSSKKEESPVVEKSEQEEVVKEEVWFKGADANPYPDNACEVTPSPVEKVEELSKTIDNGKITEVKTEEVEKVVERLVEVSAKEIKAKAKKAPKEEAPKATKTPSKKRVPKK